MKHLLQVLFILVISTTAFAQREHGIRPTATGGPLSAEQAAFDVQSYDITVRVRPETKSIEGTTVMTAKTVIPTNMVVLDLDTPYAVSKVTDGTRDLKFERTETQIRIWFPMTKQVGDEIKTSVSYSGVPKIAPNPPWIGGFMWKKTADGSDWISIACQNDGADLWFPVKDHPSDKPARVAVHATVPQPLVAASVGKLQGNHKNNDGTVTYDWLMTNPISNYEVILDIAPYRVIKDSVKSITGETIPIEFYILPESYEKGQWLVDETKKYNAFYETFIGPFPFRSQKLGIVETPHLGMEHSTIIAYGNKFRGMGEPFDWLMLHEFGHEWWANLVTATDWRDFWIHEGFQTFMDTLYVEETQGKEAYFKSMQAKAKATLNLQPVAPREPQFSYQVYLLAPDYIKSNGDIYGKGGVILHTLRYLIGDDAFFRALRRMAYPTKEMETFTDGRQTRLVNTDDFLTIAEQESKMDLDWFFELYLRQPKLPRLVSNVVTMGSGPSQTQAVMLSWETPNNLSFPMPIDVEINGKTRRVEMKDGKAAVDFTGTAPVVDPKGWVLKAQ